MVLVKEIKKEVKGSIFCEVGFSIPMQKKQFLQALHQATRWRLQLQQTKNHLISIITAKFAPQERRPEKVNYAENKGISIDKTTH